MAMQIIIHIISAEETVILINNLFKRETAKINKQRVESRSSVEINKLFIAKK